MKRFVSLLLALTMILSLCACGGGDAPAKQESAGTTTEQPTTDVGQENESAGIQVDEGLLSVEITMPATFFEEETEEEIKAAAEENGFSDCKVNEDGSVTYKMSKTKHKEMLKEMKASMDQTIEDMINGEEAVESFLKIEYQDDFSKFDVFVDPDLHTAWDGLYVIVFYMSGAYYQAFEGKDLDTIDIVVNFIDNNTNEIISTSSYREWMDSEEAAG